MSETLTNIETTCIFMCNGNCVIKETHGLLSFAVAASFDGIVCVLSVGGWIIVVSMCLQKY